MKPIHRYTLPDDIVKSVRMTARFELHKEQDPNCNLTTIIQKEEVRNRIADKIFKIIVEQEKKKLLK